MTLVISVLLWFLWVCTTSSAQVTSHENSVFFDNRDYSIYQLIIDILTKHMLIHATGFLKLNKQICMLKTKHSLWTMLKLKCLFYCEYGV